jgi:hypothetical protein
MGSPIQDGTNFSPATFVIGVRREEGGDLPHDEVRDECGRRVIRIRESQGFWSIPLTNWVKRRWPSLLAVRTGTDVANSLIYIYWAAVGDPNVQQLSWYGRDRGVYMSLLVPLKKVRLSIQRNAQWEIWPLIQPLTDAPFALVLSLRKRVVTKRERAPRKSRAKRRPPPES